MLEKNKLREKAREIRNSLDMKIISEQIVDNIQNLEVYQNASHIMIFYPLEKEVNLLHLLNKKSANKNFYLPKVQGDNLIACPYKLGDELVISKFKTLEPTSNQIDTQILDLVFVPALMVDKHLHRLGYGGGFYDRFLSKNALNSTKIVAIPSELMIEKLPSESFDAKINVIICEENHDL